MVPARRTRDRPQKPLILTRGDARHSPRYPTISYRRHAPPTASPVLEVNALPAMKRCTSRRPRRSGGTKRPSPAGLRFIGPPPPAAPLPIRSGGAGGPSPVARYTLMIFLLHLTLTLAAFVHRAGILLFPGIVTGPYADSVLQLLLALPGILVFDLGLAVILSWVFQARAETLPQPTEAALERAVRRRAALIDAAWRCALLFVLHTGDRYLCRLWIFARQHAYTILGPGFIRGLPLLDLALAAGIAAALIQGFARSPRIGGIALFIARLISLLGVGLFLALPKLLILPAFFGAPPGAGDLAVKLAALPILAALAWRAAGRAPDFLAALTAPWGTRGDRTAPPKPPVV